MPKHHCERPDRGIYRVWAGVAELSAAHARLGESG